MRENPTKNTRRQIDLSHPKHTLRRFPAQVLTRSGSEGLSHPLFCCKRSDPENRPDVSGPLALLEVYPGKELDCKLSPDFPLAID